MSRNFVLFYNFSMEIKQIIEKDIKFESLINLEIEIVIE